MPILRKTINLAVSGNTLIPTDSVTMLSTTDAGVQGENQAVMLHVAVPVDWQTLTVRLRVISESGSYDESVDAVANVIDMPIKQGVAVPGHITVSLLGLQLISAGNYAIRKTADCKSLVIKESKIPIDAIPLLYPQVFEALKSEVQTQTVHTITGSGGALVTRVDNQTVNVNVTGTGGDMLQANYANGTGSANINKVDHAMSADNAVSGWNSLAQTLTFLSAADAPTFTATTSADLRGIISVPMKIKLNQTTDKYFIVTAISATTITLYGGTDYILVSAPVNNVFYSLVKAPFGFPLDPNKWTVSTVNTDVLSQLTPAINQWYNVGSVSLSVPIGAWKLKYSATVQIVHTGTTSGTILTTLSNTNNTKGAEELSSGSQVMGASGGLSIVASIDKSNYINLSSKTAYYLNLQSQIAGADGIYFLGSAYGGATIISATCAYL
jgi:hypothetical protein